MTFLNDILNSEEEAKKSIADARASSMHSQEEAQQKANRDLADFEQSLKDKEAQAVEDQKEKLKGVYKDIVNKEKVEAASVIKSASSKEKDAVKLIHKSLL